ncbi:hypothetical protein [Streptomyces sp. WAC 06725]|uniref:hypothetical protein n=1 Tax=Streptomyces sp. WAC 06725 TaxID=2203209 RepID=UPI000F748473|nr:hypothetical protein [Streptomyces sp. WAC 06725]
MFRNATTAGIGSGSTGVINVPSGVANGAMLLLAIALEESGASPAVTGWTQAATVNGGGTQDNATRVWYRRAGSKPTSYTVTFGGSYGDSAVLATLRYTGSPLREQLATAEQRIGVALDIVEHAPAAWSREADAAWGELMRWAHRLDTDHDYRRHGPWAPDGWRLYINV